MILKIQSIEGRAPLVLLPNHRSPPHLFSRWERNGIMEDSGMKPLILPQSEIQNHTTPSRIQQSDFTHLQSNGPYPFNLLWLQQKASVETSERLPFSLASAP